MGAHVNTTAASRAPEGIVTVPVYLTQEVVMELLNAVVKAKPVQPPKLPHEYWSAVVPVFISVSYTHLTLPTNREV